MRSNTSSVGPFIFKASFDKANRTSGGAYRGPGLREGGHDAFQARMVGAFNGFVSDDPERDWPVVSHHLGYQLDSYRRYMVEGTDAPVPRPVET